MADDPARADGQGRPADARQGPPHRRLRVGRAAGGGAAVDRIAVDGRHGDGVLARGRRARRLLVHRRGRQLARRVARSHQPVRGARAAGGVLRREQPDGAVDAGARELRGARLRRQGARLRHPRRHHRRHRRRRRGRGVHVGGRSGPGRRRPGAHRAGVDADVRPRAPRRHALSRQGGAAVVGLSAAARRAATPTASSTSSGRRAIRLPATPPGSRPRRSSTRTELGRLQRWAEAAGRGAGAAGDRRAVARARTRPASACSRTSRRASRIEVLEPARRAAGCAAPALPALEPWPAVRQDRAARCSRR